MGQINESLTATSSEQIRSSGEEKLHQRYRYWRFRIFYTMFFGYALYYFSRKSFVFAMPALIEELHFTKGELGFLGTILSLSYGLSKFVSGILADRSNTRYIMASGLILTGLCNIFFGLSSSIFFFALFWGLNGWFQGFGAPPCAKLLTHWYARKERGSWWAMWSVSHNVGGAIIPVVVGFCVAYGSWRYGLFVPGIICILGGLVVLERLRDTPASLGLPTIERYKNDEEEIAASLGEEKLSTIQLLCEYVLKNRAIWLLALSYLFLYVIRTGFNDWTALFLVETKGYDQFLANSCVSLFEVGGFFGGLAAGWISDYLFSAKRGPVNALFACGVALSVFFFYLVPVGYPLFDSLALFLIGFTIFGPQMLIGVAAAELSHKKATATANGFIGWFAYAGSALAGFPLGQITQEVGWEGFFLTMVVCSMITIVFLSSLWSDRSKEERVALSAI